MSPVGLAIFLVVTHLSALVLGGYAVYFAWKRWPWFHVYKQLEMNDYKNKPTNLKRPMR